VPEPSGGWGASLLDLLLVAEQHGRAVGSAPLVEAQVAARLLAAVGSNSTAGSSRASLDGVLSGDLLVTFMPRPVGSGTAPMVPAGAVADHFVALSGDDLVLVPIGDDRTCPENLGSMPVADLTTEGGVTLASGSDARRLHDAALDEWLLLTAGALVGIAHRSLEIGVGYANERSAFGQPIGAFQAVGHRLADSAAACDGAELLGRMAAWSIDEEPDRFAELAAMAFAFAAEAARDTSYRALHLHGGYGFMLEYDIQLYYRRARAWAEIAMSPRQAYRRVADRRHSRAEAAR
ncbi:MAG TPA: acyl-CoA dehydrogenase, partial [Microthrixaceae bacterium]|nr:acyl-CoA dehydrogenase [Microthrixaceae bacterium]